MANEEMWDKLFDHVDYLKAKLEPTEADARDAFILALYGFSLSFLLEIVDHPNEARRFKDGIVKSLQQTGLSRKRIEALSNTLTDLCDFVEKTK